MNILLSGINGHMGREMINLCGVNANVNITAGVDPAGINVGVIPVYTEFNLIPDTEKFDCIVDFSIHTSAPSILEYAIEKNIPAIIATTGHTDEEIALIKAAADKIPVFYASNMSLGVAVLINLAKQAAKAFTDADIEIVETHHNRKLDAPSGTAITLANAIKEVRENAQITCGRSGHAKREVGEIGIQAVRRGNIVGIHEIHISTQNQTLTLKHEAHSRALFAEGALSALEFITRCGAGLYDMESLVNA